MKQAETANVTGVSPLDPGSRSMSISIVSPTSHPILAGIACSSKHRPASPPVPPGDPCHPRRIGGKHIPKRDEVPTRYGDLIDWYLADYAAQASGEVRDPVLSLRGLGKALRADEAADDYVRRQRSGWQ